MNTCECCGNEVSKYRLLHDTPEIKRGAIVMFNNNRGRYEVVNLLDVARYPLTALSYFTFHKDVVEKGLVYPCAWWLKD